MFNFLDKAPVITSGPEDVTGDLHETAIALGCEARGFPIPVLMWEFESATGKKIKLPGTSRLLNRSAGCVFFFSFFIVVILFLCVGIVLTFILNLGDDQMIALQVRGGPETLMVSSWIQILKLRTTDAGTYTCIVLNKKGVARASATISVKVIS